MKIDFAGYHIRSFSNKDLQPIVKHANNPRIAANLRNRFPHPYTIDDAGKWLEYVKSKKPENNFAIATPSEAIGGIGLEFMDDVHYQTAELGYWISEDYWGRGTMPLRGSQCGRET